MWGENAFPKLFPYFYTSCLGYELYVTYRVFGGGPVSTNEVLRGCVHRNAGRFSILGREASERSLGSPAYFFRRFFVYSLSRRTLVEVLVIRVSPNSLYNVFFCFTIYTTRGEYKSGFRVLFMACEGLLRVRVFRLIDVRDSGGTIFAIFKGLARSVIDFMSSRAE